MVRETRHLWVGNLPENIREDRIREHFKRYGRVQSVKLLPRCTEEKTGEITMACTVAFMDIKSASKAHNAELKIDDRTLNTEYYEPAAIPSSASSASIGGVGGVNVIGTTSSSTSSPSQNTPSPYSTSPAGTRFPNGHGSAADDHASFTTSSTSDRFVYDRSTSSRNNSSTNLSSSAAPVDVVSVPDFRRGGGVGGGYHEPTGAGGTSRLTTRNRGDRERDRSYRSTNGPTSTYLDSTTGVRSSRTTATGGGNPGGGGPPTSAGTTASWSSYESTRYNSTGSSQADTGYSTTPSENDRRNSDQAAKKKTAAKSRSGSRSVSPSGSTSSRSPSRSRSRSSSSSSSSSTSRATSSTGSPKSRRLASATNVNSNHQPIVHSDDRRPLAICVRNLPVRSSDTSLKDGLFHEYKKHGKVTSVKVVGQNSERHAIVCFKKPEDVEKALEVSYDKYFFGTKIEVAPYQGYDVEDNDLRPYEAEIDEYHPKATRTLFIGNLEKDVTASDLRKHFDQFGEIIEIDIKKQGAVSSYAFCQYSDIVSVVKAIRKMDGEHLGNNRIKLGFGKSMPYNCVWIDGVNENVNEKYLRIHFDTFGVINKVHIDRDKGQALIFYEQVLSAQAAVSKMRGFVLKNSKLQVDFASRECQESFFERLEKQGNVLERTTIFDERRETSSRSFESSSVGRFSRYETPSRPRTASYSSRSSLSASQVVSSSIQSPGGATPGSVTPRGAGSRSRARFAGDYYDPAIDYPSDRHFRNYDEYSQGSAASHDDVVVYEHEYTFVHDSPTHLDVLDSRSMQSIVIDPVPFPPSDIRNLQKERVHLLEQLQECPSSSDELMSPKKRLKLDLLDSGADVIIEANRDHRKVMEVRRLSDANLKHHTRRPSIDSSSKHSSNRDLRYDIGYMPHAVCKRRKTASSDSGSRVHHYDHSGSDSVGGSRPGTPLCDERPENLQPTEPRRVVGRDREGPLTLPLPRFAAQVMNRGSVSVAGIKGQKDNVLSSPPAVTSPRISNPRPPSPVHVPPPASPPPRPPSISSNSSDSDITPPSPSLEERIKSLDEKYEKWSGSRTVTTPATGDAMLLEKFRQKHKFIDLNLKEIQPSEIVKSVLAKRSVFDEDLKRLENVGEKYEPKELSLFPRVSGTTSTSQQQISVPATPLSAPPTLKLAPATQLPKTPTMLSPRSAGTALPAAKGLQYPFPTHPPVLMSPIPTLLPQTPSTPTTVVANSGSLPLTTSSLTNVITATMTSSTTIITPSAPLTRSIAASHGDNGLKSCASVPSETLTTTRTTSKVTVNRSNIVSCNKLPDKTLSSGDQVTPSSEKSANKSVRETKSSDKTSERITTRRDSNGNSPRADVKTRRNSDTSARRIEDNETISKEKDQNEERKKERLEKIRLENEKIEKEKQEKERIEKERLEKEKQEKERLEREKMEKDRLERESELEKQRLEKERLEKEREEKLKLEKEQAEKERLHREKEEKERREREDRERREREEQEKREREQQEKERKDKEERERREREEQERKEREEKEKREKEERERKEHEDKERREREEKERRSEEARIEKERFENEKHLERERKREEERTRHREDNHDKRNDHKHREIHSETKHKDSSTIDKHLHDSKNTKDEKASVHHEISRKDSHSSHEKSKHHIEREERRKESIKENRDNNVHDKQKGIESRHLSIDLDKNKSFLDPTKRKERNNSVPANIGSKRRMSSHEGVDHPDEAKKIKLAHEHKKVSERRDSRDSTRSEDRSKSSSKHKNNSTKSHDKHNSSKDCDEKRKDKDREERHKKHKLEKQKSKSKSREKESQENPPLPKSPITDKDFLARLDLRSTEEPDKQKKDKDLVKQKSKEPQAEEKDVKISDDKIKKEKPVEKQPIPEKQSKSRSDNDTSNKSSEEKKSKRDRVRKITNSSDSDSDEPKKHSIFDIVDDEPAYISMYDKVKARSCKNMAKQEEEKRQEKIKAKFSQLKQSRAKREEKKRSTSWDEDSDSEKDASEVKLKRCPKMLIDSSEDENHERKSRRKKDYSSDSSAIMRQVKQEPMDTSEDEIKNKHLVKGSKLRVTGYTSEDEYKHNIHVKSEIKNEPKNETLSDDNVIDVDDKTQLTKVKEDMETLLNKERRNSKHMDLSTETPVYSELTELKSEKPNNRHTFDNTSDEESHELSKKERREKKHRKKQRKQKHNLSTEDDLKLEILETSQSETVEKTKHHEKKKDHSRKEKRRDKTKDGREKPKKSKKNKSESKGENKKEGKMENIFGSLSDDSETCTKDIEQQEQKIFAPEESEHVTPTYVGENDKEVEPKVKEKSEREKDREEHKRKKEKKRREKERRLQEVAAAAAAAVAASVTAEQTSNENSMDFADMGKQLEENMLRDDSMEATEQLSKDNEESAFENSENPFRFIDVPEVSKAKEKEERREGKEKKKKRKKSKEEKGKHHHHHHHDKSKSKSSENKKEHALSVDEVNEEMEPPKPQDPSLPSLLEEPAVPEIKQADVKPVVKASEKTVDEKPPSEPPSEPTTEIATVEDTNKFLLGENDEKVHESAVQSIPDFVEEPPPSTVKEEDDIKSDTAAETTEEKPRVVISQEETEDAVAALLGESFGSTGQFEERYDADINETSDQSNTLVEETNPQDDEEMRQAVQSLSTTDLDIKPETPQSETELQIDTDTEEQEDVIPSRFDGHPKTPDIETSTAKTPDSYYQNTPDKSAHTTPPTPAMPAKPVTPATPLIIKAPSSPPSLTPIKSLSSAVIAEVTKRLDMEPKSLPLLPDNTRSVISQPWPEKKQDGVVTKEPETKFVQTIAETQPKIITASPLRVFTSPPVLKITDSTIYPPLQPISKPEQVNLSPVAEQAKIPHVQSTSAPSVSQMHNLPARPPVQNTSKPPTSLHDAVVQQTKLPTQLIHNRLPITSVMVSKPLQPTTVILQQSKIAHSLEPPKLVSTSDPRQQEKPRMVFQTTTIQSPQYAGNFVSNPPRMMVQGNIRHLTPQGLLVPTRQLTPHSFGYLGSMPHSAYNISPVIKDNIPAVNVEKKSADGQTKVTQTILNTGQNSPAQSISNTQTIMGIATSLTQPLSLPKVQSPRPSTPTIIHSPTIQSINPLSPKVSVPLQPIQTSPHSKSSNSPLASPIPKLVLSSNLTPISNPTLSQAVVTSPAAITSPKPPQLSLSASALSDSPPAVVPMPPQIPPSASALSDAPAVIVPILPKLSEKDKKSSTGEKQTEVPVREITSIPSPVITCVKEETAKTEEEKKIIEEPIKLAIEKVTEELNMTLDKESKENMKENNPPSVEEKSEKPISETPSCPELSKTEEKVEDSKEIQNITKEIEKFDNEKADTESIVSDISKERLSADILAKDDPLDTKEDSDYWSAKEVNIDSVIKTLWSADELSDHSSENVKDDWDSTSVKNENTFVLEAVIKEQVPKVEDVVVESKSDESEVVQEENTEPEEETKEITPTRTSSIRGRGARGRGRGKTRGTVERVGIQTRRGKLASTTTNTPSVLTTPTKRGRASRAKPERKTSKSESESAPADIYEFRDEPDESKEQRPRLILTIKSPAICSSNPSQTTATVKEVTKDGAKEIGKETTHTVIKTMPEPKEFVSPAVAGNKRKSRRLQEKDIRNTVDDTIEDVVKNTITPKTVANQRRSTRQTTPKLQTVLPETPRKSPRGRKPRRASEATETSSSEEASREEITKSTESLSKEGENVKEPEEEVKNPELLKDKPLEGLKAVFLRRIKGEQAAATASNSSVTTQHEPTNLIDPVTGEIIPMRECEEGKYIPLPGSKPSAPKPKPDGPAPPKEVVAPIQEPKPVEVAKTQPSVITQPQPITVVQQVKPPTLKAHVLSSQAAQAAQMSTMAQLQPPAAQAKLTVQPAQVVAVKNPVVAVIPPSPISTRTLITSATKTPVVITKSVTPIVAAKVAPSAVTKPATPINQHLSVNTSLGLGVVSSSHLSPRPNVPLTVTSKPVVTKQIVKPPVLSPVLALNQQKQILQTAKQSINKKHLGTTIIINQPQIVNTQLAHIKHQPVVKQVIVGKGPLVKQTLPMHPQQILTAAVPSPPLSKSQSPLSNSPRIIQVPSSVGPKGIMEPPKIDVSMANVMLGQRPKLSPQGPHQRPVGQAGMPVPGYEASLGETIAHFPPGPLRPPPDLNPAHYMHPSHVMQYQQYLRQQQLHLPRSGGVEKVGDGQEGEEAPVTSPPLELRRPGSVGLALAGRTASVPHSLHSPHDRATDSPQVGQVYNVHSDRMPPYYTTNRFFEHTVPPPAHQQINSHAPLAALGSDRGRTAHITPMGTPDRPLSGGHPALSAHMGSLANTPDRSAMNSHSTPERSPMGSLLSLSQIERPLSSSSSSSTHSMMRAGLGAAGNLMGAVARHIGADAPTSQRGLQAATPPHASQVPPQAESLFIMLMKQYPCMWQGLLALKNDQAAVQMYFVSGNDDVAKCCLPKNMDGSTPPLRIFQRMRLEPPQVEGVARKMQMENEHCMLLALPCGHDHMDVLKQSTNLTHGFITYLQQKQAAGIINVAAPGTTQPPAYVVHIFPSCDFVNENLRRIAPSLLERVADIAHLLIVITTV